MNVADWMHCVKKMSVKKHCNLRTVILPVISNALCNANYGGGVTGGILSSGFVDGGREYCKDDSSGSSSLSTSTGNVLSQPQINRQYQ